MWDLLSCEMSHLFGSCHSMYVIFELANSDYCSVCIRVIPMNIRQCFVLIDRVAERSPLG